MVAHVLARLAPQVGDVLINANQNLDRYRAFGHPVVPGRRSAASPDRSPDCTPGLTRATRALRGHRALRLAVPARAISSRASPRRSNGNRRSSRWRGRSTSRIRCSRSCAATCCPDLAAFLAGGGRKIDAWYATLQVVEVAFDDEADAFRNINTADELAAAADASRRRDCRIPVVRSDHPAIAPSHDSDEPAQDPARALLRRRLRSELDAGRPRARADPHVPRSRHRNRARPHPGRRSTACSPPTSSRRVAVPGHDNSAMDGYAVRFARSRTRIARRRSRGRRIVRRQAQRRRRRPGPVRAHLHGRRDARRAPTPSSCRSARARRAAACVIAAGAVDEGRAEPPLRRRGPQAGAGRVPHGPAGAPGGARHDGLARHRRGHGLPAAARRVLLDRRRAEVDRHAARPPARSTTATATRSTACCSASTATRSTWASCPTCPKRSSARSPTPRPRPTSSSRPAACRSARPTSSSSCWTSSARSLFWKIAMKPGRPLAYGRIGGAHFFGLPGNPVSVMVTFYEFVQDALLILQGQARRRAAAHVQGAARRADPQGAGTHGVPARRARRRRQRRLHRAHHRRPGLRHPVVDVAGELLHRAAPPTPATAPRATSSTCSCWKD